MDALKLLLLQKRFDLIYKYLYVISPTAYNKKAYIESIRAFSNNTFVELEPSDGKAKTSVEDYLQSFDTLIEEIKINQFDQTRGAIPVQRNGDISDGAHRLSICAALGYDVYTTSAEEWRDDIFNYEFFRARKMNPDVMDYGALEYVMLNPNTYIVNLHAVTNTKHDQQVVDILNKYGWVYYQKDVKMNLNGYVNLVKLSYGSFWEREQWIGDETDGFAGAFSHAKMSYGKSPMRIFVFVCDDLKKVLEAKAEIRALYNLGNNSVHINDTHEEAIWLAETYFNKNSLHFIKKRPYKQVDSQFEENLRYLQSIVKKEGASIEEICCVGSTPLNAYCIRKSKDLDYLCLDDRFSIEDKIISPHDDQLKYYKCSKEDLIFNPQCHFYFHGIKICTLSQSLYLKLHRHEFPKDWIDVINIIWKLNSVISTNHLKFISVDGWSILKYRIKRTLKNNKFIYGIYSNFKKVIRPKKNK